MDDGISMWMKAGAVSYLLGTTIGNGKTNPHVRWIVLHSRLYECWEFTIIPSSPCAQVYNLLKAQVQSNMQQAANYRQQTQIMSSEMTSEDSQNSQFSSRSGQQPTQSRWMNYDQLKQRLAEYAVQQSGRSLSKQMLLRRLVLWCMGRLLHPWLGDLRLKRLHERDSNFLSCTSTTLLLPLQVSQRGLGL
ncbi:hypothetical protein GE061_006701 [Apolygus lucorum]|uniref:Uncharacterized protein n=1 Tax=Apolygus lucorum TaxID=248454 RepID=A0A8S9WWB2_APOLU|nr:hypothetical protein GE061_006701 [Apolygus lucorum]